MSKTSERGKMSERAMANIESVLEEVCRAFPNGGDHDSRKQIAQKLKDSAEKGHSKLGELRTVAQIAIKEITRRRSA